MDTAGPASARPPYPLGPIYSPIPVTREDPRPRADAPVDDRRRLRWTFYVGLPLAVIASAVVAGSAFGYVVLHKAVAKIERVPDLRVAPEEDGKPVTYLIVGSDSRDAPQFAGDLEDGVGGQRADVIILIVLDPRRKAAVLMSIPRDTRVEIPGAGMGKINAAFNSGAQGIVDTVSRFVGMPVNHYVEVGFVGFMRLVDAVGRVPICTEHTLRDNWTGLYLPAGCHELDGGAALPYVRSRHTLIETSPGHVEEDPTGDFGRIQRQQQFLRALFAKVAKPGNALRFDEYIDAVGDTVRADAAFGDGDAATLGRRFLKFDPSSIFMVSLPGATLGEVRGESFVLPTDETRAFLAALRDGRPLPGEPGRPVALSDVEVSVRNGNGVPGCAALIAERLRSAGARIGEIGGGATRFDVRVTEVRHNPGNAARADVVRAAIGYGIAVEVNRPGSDVEVVVGADAVAECK